MSSEITGRVLSVVELDLDKYRITRFEAVQDGQAPANWQSTWDSGATLTAELDANFPSGKGVRLVSYGSNHNFFRYDSAGTYGDCSALALLRMRYPLPDSNAGIVLRGRGGAYASQNGYVCLILNGTLLQFYRILNGASQLLQSTTIDPAIVALDTDIYLRFDVGTTITETVTLRAKVWLGTLNDEPEDFLYTVEDSGSGLVLLEPGHAGLFGSGTTSEFSCGMFRIRSIFGSEVETLRHAEPNSYLPMELHARPDIIEVRSSPATVSLGENLGGRAQIDIQFKDARGGDKGEMYRQGTYWGKFRARELFRRGEPMRRLLGFHGQTLNEFETEHYVLDSFSGPNRDGIFTIRGQDILKFADNDRAQAPRLNNGVLAAAITSGQTTAALLPAGVGEEYLTGGFLNIGGKEIVSYSRTGDNLTIGRAQHGTIATEHDAEDRVQEVITFGSATPSDIIYTLFTDYADIDPDYIDKVAWDLEVDTYLQRLYGRVIPDPVGVNKLVSELIQQAGLIIWWDNVARLIRLQVMRGISTSAFEFNSSNVLRDTIRVEEQLDKRLTEVWTYYGLNNPLDPLDEPKNYRSNSIANDSETASLQGGSKILKINGTWIPALASDTALRCCQLQLGRFRVPPRKAMFQIMRASAITVPELGGGFRLAYDGSQDEMGDIVNFPIQITKVTKSKDKISVEAEEMLFTHFDPADLSDRVITIDTSTNNFNLRTVHDTIYPAPTDEDVGHVTVTCVINESVTVGSSTWALVAFDLGSWPTGLTVNVVVNGHLRGAGGVGGQSNLVDGSMGGTALFARHPFNLTINTGATIWSGGGGGGGARDDDDPTQTAGGGGGGGTVPGAGGPGVSPGSPGTETAGGLAGVAPPGTTCIAGNGGAPGFPGIQGFGSTVIGTPAFSFGGDAGWSVDGTGYMTVILNDGQVLGPGNVG